MPETVTDETKRERSGNEAARLSCDTLGRDGMRRQMLDRRRPPRVGFRGVLKPHGGASVLVNGAVFKTVCETVRTGSGGFDSHTPPPHESKQ